MKSNTDFLSRGGEMGSRMRAYDWESTSLGPPETWSEILKVTLRILLNSNHPMFIWWGPTLLQFYNDAYRQTMGAERHPSALGQAGRECWAEIWHIIGPEIESIMSGGNASWHQNQLVAVTRHGRREDVWWTYGYSPIDDGNDVLGVLVICNDVTLEHNVKQDLLRLNAQLVAEFEQRQNIERHQTFQLALMDRLSPLTNPDDIASLAFQMLSEQLNISRIHFSHIDIDGDAFQIEYAWNQVDGFSINSSTGTLTAFGPEVISDLSQGKTVSVSDVAADKRTAHHKNAYEAIQSRAVLVVPIIKNASLESTLGVHSKLPYFWNNNEINLLKEVAERIWNAIDRARINLQKHQAQQRLFEHQEEETTRLKSLVQQAPSFVAILRGPEHRYEIANDAYLKAIGYREMVGKTIREALPELAGQGYFELLDEVYSTGKPYIARGKSVKLQRDPNAALEELFIDFVYQPIFGTDQSVIGIFVEGSDVTPQYLSQRRHRFLLELSDRLRPLSSGESICTVAAELLGTELDVARVVIAEVNNAEGTFVIRQQWNRAGLANVSEDIKRLNDFGPEIINLIREGRPVAIDSVIADPRTIPHSLAYDAIAIQSHLSIPLVKDGQLLAIVGLHQTHPYHWSEQDILISQDMAERTWAAVESARAQAELSIERNQSSYVFNTMTEGFAVIDAQWRIIQMNAEGLRLWERNAQDVIGHKYADVFPEILAAPLEVMCHRVKITGIAETFEHDYQYREDEKAWIEIRIYPALDDGLAFFFRDITQRKEAEQKLREADRRKDEFLAMLAHELRNPLAPVSAAASLLRLTGLDENRVRQTSEIITRQVKHMTSLIDDLMDVSRVTRGLVTLDLEILEAAPLVADAIEQVRPLIESRKHRLAVHLPPETAFIEGDKKRIVQVLTNILNNAAKYTPDGGNIVMKMEVQPDYVIFKISDNGIGISNEMLESVFDLFAQAVRTSDRSQGGLGIGLAIVKSILELHKGSVTAFSKGANQGSEFTIYLPRITKNNDGLHEISEQHSLPSIKGLRIMIVDDNVDAANMLALYLQAAGHQTIVEHQSIQAFQRSLIDQQDVFLLDIGLPDMDGYELAMRLRSQPKSKDAFIIAITGYGQERDKASAHVAGFDEHIVKPVEMERLVILLEAISQKQKST